MPRKKREFSLEVREIPTETDTKKVMILLEASKEQFTISDLCAKERLVPRLKDRLESATSKVVVDYINSGKAFLKAAQKAKRKRGEGKKQQSAMN